MTRCLYILNDFYLAWQCLRTTLACCRWIRDLGTIRHIFYHPLRARWRTLRTLFLSALVSRRFSSASYNFSLRAISIPRIASRRAGFFIVIATGVLFIRDTIRPQCILRFTTKHIAGVAKAAACPGNRD